MAAEPPTPQTSDMTPAAATALRSQEAPSPELQAALLGEAHAGPDQTEMLTARGLSVVYGRSTSTSDGIVSYTNTSTTVWMIHDSTGTPIGYTYNGKSFAYGTDGPGPVTSIINPAGSQAAAYIYGPYGETTPDNGPQSAVNLLRYTGGLHDPNTGLLKLGRRLYDTGRARFTQQDSIVSLADHKNGNRYACASCNPTNNVDPTGLLDCAGALVSGAIGVASFGFATGSLIATPLTGGPSTVLAIGGYWLASVALPFAAEGIASSCF
ncbi:RHS repeat-associated core domain-containing protein [Spirillospora sp. NPDC127200]